MLDRGLSMMRRLPLLVLALLATTPAAAAAEAPVNATDADQESLLTDLGQALAGVTEAAAEAAGAVGGAMGAAFGFVGRAIGATAEALLSVAGGTAALLAMTASGVIQGATSLAAAVGHVSGWMLSRVLDATLWTLATAGSAVAFIWTAYWGFVIGLRPDAMPGPAYGAIVGTTTLTTTAVGSWWGHALLRRLGWLGSLGGGVAGFSRIQDADLLQHPARAEVFRAIQENPGIHASALGRLVGIGWGTVTHHLQKLEKARLVTKRKVTGQVCYFENGGVVERGDMAAASAVKSETAAVIVDFVDNNPMTTQKSVAQSLGISPALVSFHVKRLRANGVVDVLRQGRATRLTTTASVRRLRSTGTAIRPNLVATA